MDNIKIKDPSFLREALAVPKVGVEPTRANAHYALNVARLPIPPLRHADDIVTRF